jgi:hypothetical protein
LILEVEACDLLTQYDYGRMAMIQPRLRHRSKAYLTIETPVVAGPFRVIGDWVEPAASPAMSAMPPKAEVIS